MNTPGPSPEDSSNPFSPPPSGEVPASGELADLLAKFRRRLTWLTIAFVLLVIVAAGFDIWVMQELIQQERLELSQTKSAVVDQAKRFRNELTTAEQNIRQVLQNAELQLRNLQGMSSNASVAYSQVLSNNLGTAILARTTETAARTAEADALSVRNNRRSAQEIEVELRLSLEHTRENFRNTASNLLGTYAAELNSSLKSVKTRAFEADTLVVQLKQVEAEVKKTKLSVDTILNALRSPMPAQAPASAPAPQTVASAPPAAVARPAAVVTNPVSPARNIAIQPVASGPGFTIPVTPRPQSAATNIPPAALTNGK